MNVGLMTYIKNEAVLWSIKDIMQRKGQFDHAQIWPDMSAGLRYSDNQTLTNFFSQPREFYHAKPLHVCRRLYPAQILFHALPIRTCLKRENTHRIVKSA